MGRKRIGRAGSAPARVVEAACGRIVYEREGDIATVSIDGRPSSAVNLADPSRLVFGYMRLVDAIVAHAGLGLDDPAQRRVGLHLGGCACALPWAWTCRWPGFRQVVAEIDPDMVAAARAWFDLPRKPALSLRCQDAREALATAPAGRYSVIVRDVFANGICPADLKDRAAWLALAQATTPDGLVAANVACGLGAAKAEAARAREAGFARVYLAGTRRALTSGKAGNIVVIGSARVLDTRLLGQALVRVDNEFRLLSD